jgi:hypothetical protein
LLRLIRNLFPTGEKVRSKYRAFEVFETKRGEISNALKLTHLVSLDGARRRSGGRGTGIEMKRDREERRTG